MPRRQKLPRDDGAGGPQDWVLIGRLALALLQALRAVAMLWSADDRPWWWPWE